MSFYYLSSAVSNPSSYVNLKQTEIGIEEFITYNKGYYKEEAIFIAQEGYTLKNIKKTDYIETIPGMPLFSKRFAEKLYEDLKDEMEFFPAKLRIAETELRVYLGKIKTAVPLINMEKSDTYEIAGRKFIEFPAVLLKDITGFQFCAKDIKYNSTKVFSEAFKELVAAHQLNIEFTEYVCA